ncbi:MAG: site-specific integrase [Bacteroidales bacterium]|nr:site-specific integrase [Bacteroidales bacterium]
MNFHFSYKVIIRKDRMSPQGLAPVLLRIIINRVVRYYHLHIYIHPSLFDEVKQRIKGNSEEVLKWNYLIGESVRKAENYLFECLKEQKSPTFEEFTLIFEEKRLRDKNSLFDFMQHYININKHTYSPKTIRKYQSELNKLAKFKPVIRFSDVNELFIRSYDRYMRETLGNKTNTVAKSMTFLKSVCQLAVYEGILTKNPFVGYKIKRVPGERETLNEEELKRLIYIFYCPEEFTITKNEHYCLFYFLFSCFTGLRFGDLEKLTKQHIKDDYIELIQGKTKYKVVIPLSRPAKDLLNLIDNLNDIHPSVPIFKLFSNAATNRLLKKIAILANIKKRLTFHVARHTFATISISLNIPLYVVKDMLGHQDIKTTQIYAKVTELKRNKEIEKWNNFF